jgi:glycosyltransferase involved in cell wall biosynthesis
MRVALFTECYRPIVNGVVVSVITFAGELRKLDHDVHIIAPAYRGFTDTESNVHRLPSIMPPTRAAYPLAIPYTGCRLKAVFETQPPDIIHAQHPFATGREARRWARRLKRPLVFTYHTLIREYAHYVPLPRPLVRAAAVRLSRTFSNSADHVIVPTRGIENVLRSYGVHRPIDVIPTGLDLSLIRGVERKPMCAGLGIPSGVPLIAYSGRIAREKSLDTLIGALSMLVRRGSAAHLVLIGGGPWEDECRRLIDLERLADRVHMTGYLPRESVFDWLAEADVYCFPSLTDTQGVVVLEAMAVGCPPVAARSGAVEDVIRDGTDGLIVEPTAEAFADAISQILSDGDLRCRLAGQAKQRAEEFSADRMAQRLVRVYEKLLGIITS